MKISLFKLVLVTFSILINACANSTTTTSQPTVEIIESVTFSVIGDVPYNNSQRDGLIAMIAKHNMITSSEFVVHVGDIKPGADPCAESVYEDVSTILKTFKAPTFIILGDNEFNDCNEPLVALSYWHQYFLHFNENWTFDQTITYQTERPENFSWFQNQVLFIGLNLVGSSVQDQNEWTTRLSDDANFVSTLIENHKNDAAAIVIFGHANMVEIGPAKFEPFTIPFRAAAASFKKPILYLQGDGHVWYKNKPWEEQNITRVQIEGGANAVQVTVDVTKTEPFTFNRTFLD